MNDPDIGGVIVAFTKEISHLAGEVGKLSGQVRELIHQGNNTSQKLEFIGPEVTKLQGTVGRLEKDFSEFKCEMKKEMGELKASELKRAGAQGFIQWFLQSPVIGWIVAACLFFAAIWAREHRL